MSKFMLSAGLLLASLVGISASDLGSTSSEMPMHSEESNLLYDNYPYKAGPFRTTQERDDWIKANRLTNYKYRTGPGGYYVDYNNNR